MLLYEIYHLDFNYDQLISESLMIEGKTFDRKYISNKNGGIQIHNSAWEKIFTEIHIQKYMIPTLKSFLFEKKKPKL